MKKGALRLILFCLAFWALSACRPSGDVSPLSAVSPLSPSLADQELSVVTLPITGQFSQSQAEVSGMAWYGDYLIVLPQYPSRFDAAGQAALFALPKAAIIDFIDGNSEVPLEALAIPFDDAGLADTIAGFEGYEALGFKDDRVYLTVEASPADGMHGYLVSGSITPDLSQVQLEADSLVEILPQAPLSNMSDETLVVVEDVVLTLYEANGKNVNPLPLAHRFDLQLNEAPPLSFPNVEYRITDATAADETGQFWAINYFWPGDRAKLDPADDLLLMSPGEGATHTRFEHVERLVAFQYDDTGLVFADHPPLQLRLPTEDARNWEALVRLDERGFLLMTDKHPETLLGFVAFDEP